MADNPDQQGLVYTNRNSLMNRLYPLVKLAWVFVIAIGPVSYTHLTLPTNREV